MRLRVITARSLTCSLDRYLLPLSGLIDVSVMDTGGSPVRQWGAVSLDRGIVADELILADEPALGEWTIQVRKLPSAAEIAIVTLNLTPTLR